MFKLGQVEWDGDLYIEKHLMDIPKKLFLTILFRQIYPKFKSGVQNQRGS